MPYDLKRKFRYIEKISKKINNLEWSIVLNETCLNKGIMPKYSKKTLIIAM